MGQCEDGNKIPFPVVNFFWLVESVSAVSSDWLRGVAETDNRLWSMFGLEGGGPHTKLWAGVGIGS